MDGLSQGSGFGGGRTVKALEKRKILEISSLMMLSPLRIRLVAATLLAALTVTACAYQGAGKPETASSSPNIPPAHSALTDPSGTPPASSAVVATPKQRYLGVFETNDGISFQGVNQFSRAVHVSPNIVLNFVDMPNPFKARFAKNANKIGAMPMFQIDPIKVGVAAIAAGQYDGYFRSFADQARAFGHPILIGFGHEMNGTWYPWGAGHVRPTTFITAWRRIVRIFNEQGASNVKWLWTINVLGGHVTAPAEWWPGAAYVTWVGIDGYYYVPSDTFESVYSAAIEAVRHLTGKPILLSEVGVGQLAGQAAHIPNLFAGIEKYGLIGLVWMDVTRSGGEYHQNWRLEGHRAALLAFTRGWRSLG